MKQHITREQLNEVLRPQSSTDIETSTSRAGSSRAWLNGKQPDDITIGRMIEFLYENEGITVESNGWNDDWRLFLHWTFNSDSDWGRELDEKDGICDALWEACKEILERKK